MKQCVIKERAVLFIFFILLLEQQSLFLDSRHKQRLRPEPRSHAHKRTHGEWTTRENKHGEPKKKVSTVNMLPKVHFAELREMWDCCKKETENNVELR